MQMVNRNPSVREVRNFGLINVVGLLAISGLLWLAEWHRLRNGQALAHWSGSTLQCLAVGLSALGVLTGVITLVSNAAGRRTYVAWMTGAFGLGIAMTFVLLTVLYFVLLPVFSLIRLKDPLRLRRRGPEESYWEEHVDHPATPERTLRPF
jgi:hypothetical protein